MLYATYGPVPAGRKALYDWQTDANRGNAHDRRPAGHRGPRRIGSRRLHVTDRRGIHSKYFSGVPVSPESSAARDFK